jgi:lipopolysaccharide biosynthesis protein
MMKRICFFSGSNPIIHKYVIYFVQQLAESADVYFIADRELPVGELDKLTPFVKEASSQPHGKGDFGSWATLAEQVGWSKIAEYDELLLCNDSCYGPLQPLDSFFEKFESNGSDFYQLLGSEREYQHRTLFLFNRTVIQHSALRDYLSGVCADSKVKDPILKYDVPLADYMENYGFKGTTAYLSQESKPLLVDVAEISNCVHREYFAHLRYYARAAEHWKNYPVRLIEDYYRTQGELLESDVNIDDPSEGIVEINGGSDVLRLLVHLHIFYPEQLPYFIKKLKSLRSYKYDLVVTLTGELPMCRTLLQTQFPEARVLVVDNKGYDVAPFLSALRSVNLDDYDYVLKLHTKGYYYKPVALPQITVHGYRWRNILVDSLLGSEQTFTDSLRLLERFPNVGMVGAVPFIFQNSVALTSKQQNAIYDLGSSLLGHSIKGMAYDYVAGTMFLCRAKLLKPLAEYSESQLDFQVSTGTGGWEFVLAHQMERCLGLLVYAAGQCIAGVPYHGDDDTEERIWAETIKENEEKYKRKMASKKKTVRKLVILIILLIIALGVLSVVKI